MKKKKKQKKYIETKTSSIFSIFFESIKLYFINIDKIISYLFFPVFGQIFSIVLIFILTFFYAKNITYIYKTYPFFENTLFSFLVLIIIVLPGFILFSKAFFSYILAYGSIVSSSINLSTNGRITSFKIHDEIIIKRLGSYISLILLVSLIMLMSFPILIIGPIVAGVLLSLSIQSFVLNEDKNSFGAIKDSIETTIKNFFPLCVLLFILGALTYVILPDIINYLLIEVRFDKPFIDYIVNFTQFLPLNQINDSLKELKIPFNLDYYKLASSLFKQVIAFIVIGFTLPFRTIALTLFYRRYKK